MNPDMRIETEEVEELIRTEVLKRDLVEGEAAKKALAQVKRASDRTLRKRPKKEAAAPQEEPVTELVL